MSTIAAISTPPAAGGIAVIRVSGEDSLRIAGEIFRVYHGKPVTEMDGYTCAYGVIEAENEQLDDVILTVFRAPHSFTGEDTVEISCHGGIYLSRRILHLLYQKGAEPADAGEFTRRAFLNGKLSLMQAEAVMDVIQADGQAALRHANMIKDGKLSTQMREIANQIIRIQSALAYWLDDAEEFPPELEPDTLAQQITEIRTALYTAAQNYRDGRVLRDGIHTILLGRPNAGKSTVMNWLCGMNRSIVTDIAGTTRDVVTEQVHLGDFTLILSDTAGIRETQNQIEAIGIAQAKEMLAQSDLILYIIDAAAGMTEADHETLKLCDPKRTVILWNKTDISDAEPPQTDCQVVSCAAARADSTEQLQAAIRNIFPNATEQHPLLMHERQFRLVSQALEAVEHAEDSLKQGAEPDLLTIDLEAAANALFELDGKNAAQETVDAVFSRFCVGK